MRDATDRTPAGRRGNRCERTDMAADERAHPGCARDRPALPMSVSRSAKPADIAMAGRRSPTHRWRALQKRSVAGGRHNQVGNHVLPATGSARRNRITALVAAIDASQSTGRRERDMTGDSCFGRSIRWSSRSLAVAPPREHSPLWVGSLHHRHARVASAHQRSAWSDLRQFAASGTHVRVGDLPDIVPMTAQGRRASQPRLRQSDFHVSDY